MRFVLVNIETNVVATSCELGLAEARIVDSFGVALGETDYWFPPEGYIAVPAFEHTPNGDIPDTGWSWTGKEFLAAELPPPPTIDQKLAKAGLTREDILAILAGK